LQYYLLQNRRSGLKTSEKTVTTCICPHQRPREWPTTAEQQTVVRDAACQRQRLDFAATFRTFYFKKG